MSVQETITMMAELAETTIGTAENHYITIPTAGEWLFKAAYINVHTTVAASGSHYATIALKQGATTVASVDTSATTLTAGTSQALTNAAAGASAELGQGDTLHLAVTKTGSGVAVPGIVTVSLQSVVS
jgi:hypothetical protein